MSLWYCEDGDGSDSGGIWIRNGIGGWEYNCGGDWVKFYRESYWVFCVVWVVGWFVVGVGCDWVWF